MVVGLLAILKAGAAFVPLDPALPPHRLAFLLADADLPLVLTAQSLSPRLPPSQARLLCLDALPLTAAAAATGPLPVAQPDNAAYLIYTSGSTGQPKGALNSHAGISNLLAWMQEAMPLGARDRLLQKTPLSFDVSVWEVFWPLLNGAALV